MLREGRKTRGPPDTEKGRERGREGKEGPKGIVTHAPPC